MRNVLIVLVLGALVHAVRAFRPHSGELSGVAGTALAFGFFLLAAFYAGRVFSSLRLPKIVAYVVTGMVAGPHVLELITEPMVRGLGLVSGVAVCLIALTAGGELNLRRIRPLLRTIASLSFFAVLGTCIALTALVWAMRPMLPFLDDLHGTHLIAMCAMLGVALSAQSPAVVMALFSEMRADGPVSRTILGTVVIADLVVIVLFGVTSSLVQSSSGAAPSAGSTALGIAWELGGSMIAGVIVGALLALYIRFAKIHIALFVLLLCVVVAEVGRRIHLDPLIVMLAAGLFLENATRGGAAKLVHDIESASLPVYLVFFAVAGAGIHLDVLGVLGIPAAIIVIARAASFWLGSRIAGATARAEPLVRRWAFAGLLPQAGLALALALLIARTVPGIGEEASALILAVIAVNELLMPVVLRRALVASGEAGQRAEEDFDAPPPTTAETVEAETAEPEAPAH